LEIIFVLEPGTARLERRGRRLREASDVAMAGDVTGRGLWHAGAVTSEPDAALVAEACKRSSLLWVRSPGARAQPAWHVWHDGAVLLVVDGQEQPDPTGGAGDVEVSVRSKDAGSRLVAFPAAVEVLEPGTSAWDDAVAVLKAERLNARDAGTIGDRWAAGSRVLRLRPAGPPVERPGDYDDSSGALPPAPSPATTVRRRPFHLGGRRRRR
jgi:hypothetical protein